MCGEKVYSGCINAFESSTLLPSAVSVVMGSGAEPQIQSFIKEQNSPKFDENPSSNSSSNSYSNREEKSWCQDVWEGEHHPSDTPPMKGVVRPWLMNMEASHTKFHLLPAGTHGHWSCKILKNNYFYRHFSKILIISSNIKKKRLFLATKLTCSNIII